MADLQIKIQSAPISYFLLISILLGGLYYLSGFDDGTAIKAQMNAKRSTLNQAKIKLEANARIASNLDFYEENVNKISKQFQQAITYLPSEANVSKIITSLQIEQRKSGVNLTKVKPQNKNIKKTFYEEMPIDIEVQGEFKQITNFLANVSKMKRIITVRDMQLTSHKSKEGRTLLTLKAMFVAFRYIEPSIDKKGGNK